MLAYDPAAPARRQALPANDTWQTPLQILNLGATVRALPGAGGTVSVQYSLSPVAEVEAGTAVWYAAPALTSLTASAEDVVEGRITAIRAKQTAGSAAGALEVCQ